MNKKGFTLIELLAVIVILGIIALIAVPIIMNIIKDSQRGAFQNSAYGIIKAAEMLHINRAMEGTDLDEQIFYYSNSVETNHNNLKLKYKGQKPQYGEITLSSDGTVKLWLWWNGFCAVKGENAEGVTVTDMSSDDCGQASIPPTIAVEGYTAGQQIEITIMPGDTLNLPNVTAYDSYNNDLTSDIVQSGSVDTHTPGTYEITYSVTDSNNNTETRTIIIQVQDNVAPTIVINPMNNSTWGRELAVQLSVSDSSGIDNNSLRYVWSTDIVEPNDFPSGYINNGTIHNVENSGEYYLWVKASDIYGNTSVVRSDLYYIDNTGPNISSINLSINLNNLTQFTLTRGGVATDIHSGLPATPYVFSVRKNEENWQIVCITNNVNCVVTNLDENETYYYQLCVTDNLLNSSCTAMATIQTAPTLPVLTGGFSSLNGIIEKGSSISINWGAATSWGFPQTSRLYRLEVSYEGDNFIALTTRNYNTNNYVMTVPASLGDTIQFRVRAENQDGASEWVYSDVISLEGWTLYSLYNQYNEAVYNYNGQWVVVGRAGRALVSNNAIDWETYVIPNMADNTLGGVRDVYNYNGRWIVVGSNSRIGTSLDAMTWTSQVVGPTGTGYNKSYNYNGRWVVVGSQGSIATSLDGVTWTHQTLGTEIELIDVYNYNGRWVAVGYTGSGANQQALIATSTNGTTWSTWAYSEIGSSQTLYKVYNHNGRWVAVGQKRVLTSTNGTTWTLAADSAGIYYDVYHDGTKWITVGTPPSPFKTGILTSTNGTAWTLQTIENNILEAVHYNGGRWVAVGRTSLIAISTDGITWETRDIRLNGTTTFNDIYYYNGTWVAVGTNGRIGVWKP